MSNYQEKFIIGLGNPGRKYDNNRHNIGFLFIQEFASNYSSKFVLKNKIKCNYSEFIFDEVIYRMFMPTTFMNNSGEAIRAIIDWFKVDKNKLIIVVDDIDLPLGRIRVRKKGTSGGHNGLKSIINHLNSKEFLRIRIGIGSPPLIENDKKSNTISHVLGNFTKSEKLILNKIFCQMIESLQKLNDHNENTIICELNSFNINEI
tara:strand:+ start:589 stop:1200 length:612 start_codon:yes stop_codon:yes gene_type:complete